MSFDRQLINLLKSNDEEKIRYAFNCVYKQYYKLVCFCISQYVEVKEDIEDLAADTFVALFNNIEKLKEERNLKYYILTIAKNNAIDFLKKYKTYSSLDDGLLNVIPYHHEFKSNTLIERLKEVLTMHEIDILVNHLIYGYSFKEIAQHENKPINTIISTYHRSIKKAYNFLNEVQVWIKKRKKY